MTTEEKIWKTLNSLRMEAVHEDKKMSCRGEYEWELGTNIVSTLGAAYIKLMKVKKEAVKLMDYPIRVNLVDPEVINLWKRMEAEGNAERNKH